MSYDLDDLQRLVRQAARALGRSGLAHAYGHCSARIDEEYFLVCAARPMALIEAGEEGIRVPVRGTLPEGVLGEVRIHQQIYDRRQDVNGICRAMPAKTMTLSTLRLTPKPRHGFGSYFAPLVPLWDDPQLLRSDQRAGELAELLVNNGNAVVMRGNGAVTAADSLQVAVVLMWYLEDAARVELEVLSASSVNAPAVLDENETRLRATREGRIFERMWEYLTAGDPEQKPL